MFRHGLLWYCSLFIFAASSCLTAQTIVIPADSVMGPMCVCTDTVHNVAVPLSPKKSKYNVVVTDGLAKISLTQMFVNDYGDIKDLVYVFPLPHEGAVHEMAMEYKGMLYTADIYEKDEAKEIYDSVAQTGGNAALLLQDRPNVFQQRLANIAFNDTAWVKIALTMPLSYDNGTYTLDIPTMVAERFQSENTSTVKSSGRLWNPPADREGQTLQINVLLQTGYPIKNIESPTHPLYIGELSEMREELELRDVIKSTAAIQSEDPHGILLENAVVYPNKDFVLRFSRKSAEMDYTIASYFDTASNTGYFYGNVFPDTSIFSGDRPNLDIVLLIDISGSQGGWPIEKEKEIANTIINKLTDNDKLSVLSFNTMVAWCFDENESVVATGENREEASAFVNELEAGGGTNLLNGVKAALAMPLDDGLERFFIFLTDGFITNEDAIFSVIKEHPTEPTIFTFGAGDNLNNYFLDESAKVGNGVGTKITRNESAEEVVLQVWDKIESPQLKNVAVDCEAFDSDNLLIPLGKQLYKGTPLTFYGTYTSGGEQTVTVSGYRDGEKIEIEKTLELTTEANSSRMISQMWAKQMIQWLRLDEGTGTANKDRIVELSKQFEVLSDYTAFLAIQPVEATEDNSISGGMTEVKETIPTPLEKRVMIHQFPDKVIIQTAGGSILKEINIYDISGRCIMKVKLTRGLTYYSCEWKQLFKNRLARGQYILLIKTNVGQLTRKIFIR